MPRPGFAPVPFAGLSELHAASAAIRSASRTTMGGSSRSGTFVHHSGACARLATSLVAPSRGRRTRKYCAPAQSLRWRELATIHIHSFTRTRSVRGNEFALWRCFLRSTRRLVVHAEPLSIITLVAAVPAAVILVR